MKKIKLTLLTLLGFATVSFAQQKAVEKVVIKTPTVQCEQCKDRIENYLKREPGISAVRVDYKKKTTTVTYLTDRNNIEQIKTAIANAGYEADDVTADEDAYKKLPKCCKKPEGVTNGKKTDLQ
ncbi:heavy-metal-associated domain-containing protein [Ferruginibacter paludis]|uniref:heavy-metal-associated domain-containing protein n=1 Tax=Ferruginibacter paludis TaxID=1310417 RepID=UPI0025B46F83|nr:heavy-metal-associated domain-containing protein [Ferruginibacter paludis]MDN3656943.1 heavy-metal-associated domain-containing protein [Ferruginibacter paludis]